MAPTTTIPPAGCLLEEFAEDRGISQSFLLNLGVSQTTYQNVPALRIPHLDETGRETAVLFRTSLRRGPTGSPFRWKAGDRPCPYGLHLLDKARKQQQITVVEGPSDALTLMYSDFPALGLPSARWDERWASHFDGIATIYVIKEPGAAGEKLIEKIASSAIAPRVKVIELNGFKDPSEMWMASVTADAFEAKFKAEQARAFPVSELRTRRMAVVRAEALKRCARLAAVPDILDKFRKAIERSGVVGEATLVSLLYLAVTSRLLRHVVSVALKAQSSSGKSFVTDQVLNYFPPSSRVFMTGMSEKALVYGDEPLAHRMIVIAEAGGLSSDFQNYTLRTLLSEGRLVYQTVDHTSQGLKVRKITREGPTGLIITTTALRLHPENETRLLTLSVNDTAAHTKAVMLAMASDRLVGVSDEWIALQEWIEAGDTRVVVRFATSLADRIAPFAIRLRRDFRQLLSLFQTHALLHQQNRPRNRSGVLMATRADYEAVAELLEPILGEALRASIPPTIRETVEAVQALNGVGITVGDVAQHLKIDPSAASRRVAQAAKLGYLIKRKEGRSFKLFPGASLPSDRRVLPDASELFNVITRRPRGGTSGSAIGTTSTHAATVGPLNGFVVAGAVKDDAVASGDARNTGAVQVAPEDAVELPDAPCQSSGDPMASEGKSDDLHRFTPSSGEPPAGLQALKSLLERRSLK